MLLMITIVRGLMIPVIIFVNIHIYRYIERKMDR